MLGGKFKRMTLLAVFNVIMIFPCIIKGDFIMSEVNQAEIGPCDTTAHLSWNYTTDETVTVIEWYKQPGQLIARIFGVNVGALFTVIPPYNAAPYNVSKNNSYNAAITISGMSPNDSGVYSVNVTASSPQSSTSTRTILPSLDTKPYVDSRSERLVCYVPKGAIDADTTWSKNSVPVASENGSIPVSGKGDYTCCLTGGNADCAPDPLCFVFTIEVEDCTFPDVCSIALLVFGTVTTVLFVIGVGCCWKFGVCGCFKKRTNNMQKNTIEKKF